jgi:hypothetical protein
MKKLLFVIILLALTSCDATHPIDDLSNFTTDIKADEIIVIGTYRTGPVCSTDICANDYDTLGGLPISQRFSWRIEHSGFSSINYIAIGEWVKVQEPPMFEMGQYYNKLTGEKVSNPNATQEVKLFKVRKYQPIDFYRLSISEDQIDKFIDEFDTSFSVEVSNPTSLDIRATAMFIDHDREHIPVDFQLASEDRKSFDLIWIGQDSTDPDVYSWITGAKKHKTREELLEDRYVDLSIMDTVQNDNIIIAISNGRLQPWKNENVK